MRRIGAAGAWIIIFAAGYAKWLASKAARVIDDYSIAPMRPSTRRSGAGRPARLRGRRRAAPANTVSDRPPDTSEEAERVRTATANIDGLDHMTLTRENLEWWAWRARANRAAALKLPIPRGPAAVDARIVKEFLDKPRRRRRRYKEMTLGDTPRLIQN